MAPPFEKINNAFTVDVIFNFEWQYSYMNYKASFFDALTKFCLLAGLFYLFVLLVRTLVRRNFYKELRDLIRRVDSTVHDVSGYGRSTGKQAAHQRFAHMLDLRTLYKNAMTVKSFEDRLLSEKHSKKTMKIDGLKVRLRELFKVDKQIEER